MSHFLIDDDEWAIGHRFGRQGQEQTRSEAGIIITPVSWERQSALDMTLVIQLC